MSDGRTATRSACRAAGVDAEPPAEAGATGANAGWRPTWFSHSLDWDSWIDIDVPVPRFVRASPGAIWRS